MKMKLIYNETLFKYCFKVKSYNIMTLSVLIGLGIGEILIKLSLNANSLYWFWFLLTLTSSFWQFEGI